MTATARNSATATAGATAIVTRATATTATPTPTTASADRAPGVRRAGGVSPLMRCASGGLRPPLASARTLGRHRPSILPRRTDLDALGPSDDVLLGRYRVAKRLVLLAGHGRQRPPGRRLVDDDVVRVEEDDVAHQGLPAFHLDLVVLFRAQLAFILGEHDGQDELALVGDVFHLDRVDLLPEGGVPLLLGEGVVAAPDLLPRGDLRRPGLNLAFPDCLRALPLRHRAL